MTTNYHPWGNDFPHEPNRDPQRITETLNGITFDVFVSFMSDGTPCYRTYQHGLNTDATAGVTVNGKAYHGTFWAAEAHGYSRDGLTDSARRKLAETLPKLDELVMADPENVKRSLNTVAYYAHLDSRRYADEVVKAREALRTAELAHDAATMRASDALAAWRSVK